jgi:hypothetical protein
MQHHTASLPVIAPDTHATTSKSVERSQLARRDRQPRFGSRVDLDVRRVRFRYTLRVAVLDGNTGTLLARTADKRHPQRAGEYGFLEGASQPVKTILDFRSRHAKHRLELDKGFTRRRKNFVFHVHRPVVAAPLLMRRICPTPSERGRQCPAARLVYRFISAKTHARELAKANRQVSRPHDHMKPDVSARGHPGWRCARGHGIAGSRESRKNADLPGTAVDLTCGMSARRPGGGLLFVSLLS